MTVSGSATATVTGQGFDADVTFLVVSEALSDAGFQIILGKDFIQAIGGVTISADSEIVVVSMSKDARIVCNSGTINIGNEVDCPHVAANDGTIVVKGSRL